jgi:hypothetical protein
MNDDLMTRLRAAADADPIPVRPVDQLIRDARRRRTRHRAGALTGGLASVALVAGAAVLSGVPLPGTADDLNVTATAPATPTATTGSPTTPTPTDPSGSTGTGPATKPASPGPTTSAWPEPPTTRVIFPALRAGHDYGDITAARYENGKIIITVDRIQIYTREEWQQRTGELIGDDYRSVNTSTRTRDFVVEPEAWVNVSEQFIPGIRVNDHMQRIEARELVTLTNQTLERRKARGSENPGIGVWLFHRGGIDGPVAYLEDAALTMS